MEKTDLSSHQNNECFCNHKGDRLCLYLRKTDENKIIRKNFKLLRKCFKNRIKSGGNILEKH